MVGREDKENKYMFLSNLLYHKVFLLYILFLIDIRDNINHNFFVVTLNSFLKIFLNIYYCKNPIQNQLDFEHLPKIRICSYILSIGH